MPFPRLPSRLHALWCCVMLLYEHFASQTSRFVQCYSLGPLQVLHALLYSTMVLYARFASQTSGLCRVIPSAPTSCTLRYIQYCSCMSTLPSRCRVWAVLLPSAPVGCTLCYVLYYSVLFLSRLLCLENAGFAQHYSFGTASFLHVCFLGLYYSVTCSSCFAFSSYTYFCKLCNYFGLILLCTCCCIVSSPPMVA